MVLKTLADKTMRSLPVSYVSSWDILARARALNLQKMLGKREFPLKVLDVGGGIGLNSIAFAGKGHTVVSLDISLERLTVLQAVVQRSQPQSKVHCLAADGYKLPLKSCLFDLVICCHVIEHLEYPSQFLAEVSRVLVDDGLLLLSTPSDYRKIRISKALGIRIDPRDHVVEGFTPEAISEILPPNLKLIEYQYDGKIIGANIMDLQNIFGRISAGNIESASQKALHLAPHDNKWLKYLREAIVSPNLFLIFIVDDLLLQRKRGIGLNCLIRKER
jgi:ubiquinone/menaquinone biosynthesis C-methylase UbiE